MKKKLTTIFFAIFSIFLISSFILFFKVYTQYKENEEIYKTKLENPPLVSVIIPFYNRKEYINKAIDSVLNQSYDNLEIILVDDHSTDGTYEILQEYADKDKRIKLFRNEKNMHVSFTRNVGIKNSTGKYLYFIDSDDWIDRRFIEEMVLYAEKYDLDIIHNKNIHFTKNEKNTGTLNKYLIDNKKIDKNLLIQKLPFACTKLFKKEIQTKNNIFFMEDLYFAGDMNFVNMFSLYTNKSKLINSNNVYYYRIKHGNSIAQNTKILNKIKNLIYSHKTIKNHIKNNNMQNSNGGFSHIPYYFLENLENDDKVEEAYQLTREYFKEIEEDVLNNKNLYDDFDLMVFRNILEFDNYNDFKKNYDNLKKTNIIKLFIIYIYSIVLIVFLFCIIKKAIIPCIMLIPIFKNKNV